MSDQQLSWGQQGSTHKQNVVAMTAGDAQNLSTLIVANVVKAVVEKQSVDALEAYKQSARLETEVARQRELLGQRDAEIAGLNQHVARLTQFISSMQAAPVQPQYTAPTSWSHTPAPNYAVPVLVPELSTNHTEG